MRTFLLCCALLCGASPVLAIDSEVAFEDPVLQRRYEEMTRLLRCPMCQNQAIADSPVGIAADLRRELREQITAGRSDSEIKDFMTARYGDFILYNPPVNSKTLLLWAAPALLLLAGLTSAAVVIVRRSRAAIPDDAQESEAGAA